MKISLKEVDCVVRSYIPDPHETFATDYNLDEFPIHMIVSVDIYLRDINDCPFARGNWMCDIRFNDGGMYCIKLPAEMEREDVYRFYEPLIVTLENFKHSKVQGDL